MILDTVVFDSTNVRLEFSELEQYQVWQQCQAFSSAFSRWNAYLNQIALKAILPWLREEYLAKATISPASAALPSFWEVVNGTAIVADNIRFVLIPSESIDFSELRVPQEWVDIPSWTADYYLAVNINPDERGVVVWGYATHQQLKTMGTYDSSDRTYYLQSENLTLDLNVLWVARQLGLEETTRVTISPLATLPLTQAQNLIQRLGNPAITLPRLAVPFQIWGALLEHGGTRQQLYEKRLGLPQKSIIDWLRSGVSDIAQQIGWGQIELQPSFVGGRGEELTSTKIILSRQLQLAGQNYELRVFPVGNIEDSIWRFELRNSTIGGLIPGGVKLRLLTEDLQPFEGNEDIALTAQESLYIDVALAPEEGLVWETEPLPDNYDQEILRF